ncbi:hypothetical protein ACF0H5_012614 [Mactra antiquata]
MYQLQVTSLWFFIMCRQISELLANEPIHFGHWVKSSNNDNNVDYYTFEWKIKVSKKDCVNACKSTEVCEYINFEVRSHLCALVTIKDDRKGRLPVIEKKPGYIYMNKSEWIVDKVQPLSNGDDSTVSGGNDTVKENKNAGKKFNMLLSL